MAASKRRRLTHDRSLVHAEDLDATAADLLSSVRALASPPSVRKTELLGRVPDVSRDVELKLRALLEDEIVPAVETADGSIRSEEVRHEIIKKALAGLKLPIIREISRTRGFSGEGKTETLVTQIAKSYGWNDAEIAQVIFDNEEEPTRTDNGHSTRIFHFTEAPDIGATSQKLKYATGRYIRTGIARWFVFQQAVGDTSTVRLAGSYRSYTAGVEENVDGSAAFTSKPAADDTEIVIDSRTTFAVHNAGLTTSRSAVSALRTATGAKTLDYLPKADTRAVGIPGRVHPSSTFLLDLLYNRFRAAKFSDVNINLARFRVTDVKDDDSGEGSSLKRPLLRAVRFEGDHLLDSIPACQLITDDGRPLTEIAVTVVLRGGESNTIQGRFPIRVTLENDHAHVSTGYGSVDQLLSLQVHREVVESVRGGFESGVLDEARLASLVERMQDRAGMNATPETADMLD